MEAMPALASPPRPASPGSHIFLPWMAWRTLPNTPAEAAETRSHAHGQIWFSEHSATSPLWTAASRREDPGSALTREDEDPDKDEEDEEVESHHGVLQGRQGAQPAAASRCLRPPPGTWGTEQGVRESITHPASLGSTSHRVKISQISFQ